MLGSDVVAAQSQPGGFSEGLAAYVRLADGRGVFMKAANALRELSLWAVTRLDDLVALEEQAEPATAGRTLLHGDLYPFNVMLAGPRVAVWTGRTRGSAPPTATR